MATNIFDQHLDRNPANFVALSPVSFVERSAEVFGDRTAVVHGARRYTWAQTRERSARLAAALKALGVVRGSTVSVMLSNTPEMVEAHYAVPALNAVLNTLNTRLDAPLIAWQLNHCEAPVLITDREFAPTMRRALELLRSEHVRTPVVIDVDDSEYRGDGERLGAHEYEALLRRTNRWRARRPGRRVGRDRRLVHLGHHRRPEGRGHASPRRVPQRGVQRGDVDHAEVPEVPVDACRCSTATAGASRGRWRCRAARTSACAGRSEGDPRRDARARRRPLLRGADRARPARHCQRRACAPASRRRCAAWSPAPRRRHR